MKKKRGAGVNLRCSQQHGMKAFLKQRKLVVLTMNAHISMTLGEEIYIIYVVPLVVLNTLLRARFNT